MLCPAASLNQCSRMARWGTSGCAALSHPHISLPSNNATRSEDEKLISLLREFQADERLYLTWFEEAEAEGGRRHVDVPAARHCMLSTLSARVGCRGAPF